MDNYYVIDSDDRIVEVGPTWDQQALDYDAPGASSKHVMGRKWWEFVDGFQTKSYLNAIFFACRMDHHKLSMGCRCDAPDEKAMFRLIVEPQPDDRLKVVLRQLVDADGAKAVNVVDIEDHIGTQRCSICCSFLLGENWIDPFCTPDSRFFAQSYAVCPTCKRDAADIIAKIGARRDPSGKLIPFEEPPE